MTLLRSRFPLFGWFLCLFLVAIPAVLEAAVPSAAGPSGPFFRAGASSGMGRGLRGGVPEADAVAEDPGLEGRQGEVPHESGSPGGQGGGAKEDGAHAEGGGVHEGGGAASHEPWNPPVWAVLPFILMLLCIAVIPLINNHWWENDRNRGLISLLLGLPTVLYTWQATEGFYLINHTLEEYISFIVLLGSLFVISGGILITGNLKGTPWVNTAFLGVGGLLASFIGTTGAAMLLIRPVLSTNSERKHKLHTVIFFIFIVCNCGGCLTPLGDPPLFLGYLKGVPFTWTFSLYKEWAFVLGFLLLVYFLLDSLQYRKEEKKDIRLDIEHERPLVIRGAHNFLFLAGVVAAVAMTEVFSFGSREGFMILMTLFAWFTTRPEYRKENHFTFAPIREVAVVFIGIFATMIPALALLQARGDQLGVTDTTHFFWVTGTLSSFLDNAPTYVSFLALANGVTEWPKEYLSDVLLFAQGHGAEILPWPEALALGKEWAAQGVNNVFHVPEPVLTSISLGAVFMGSMTYIGNGPNFMVRAIADQAGIKMPSFFGYILWSGILLLPIFFIMTQIFL